MKIIDCIQGQPEWWEAKQGIPSASNFDRIITAKTMKPAAGMDGYIAELIAERICQLPNFFTVRGRPPSPAVANGIEQEPNARRLYQLERQTDVLQVGFCVTEDGRFGCSPDGLVEGGGLELKCPQLDTQVAYLLDGGGLPTEYRAQVHGALVVSGRPWWDFMSYAPPLDPILIRVEPDEFTVKLKEALEIFWEKYDIACRKVLRVGALMPLDRYEEAGQVLGIPILKRRAA